MRVLVAEDDPALAELLVEALLEEGHQVTSAGTPDGALRLASLERWDVILLDTFDTLPGGPAPEFLALVRQLAARAPVVLCSARSWATQDRASELGVAAVVPKPFDLDELLATLRSTLAP